MINNMLFIMKTCLMVLFLNLYCFSHMFGTIIPKCTEMMALIATGAMCLRLIVNGKGFKQVKKAVTPMVVFFVYCFATGVGLTIFGLYYVQLVYPLTEKILVVILISYIIYNDESPKYVLNLCIAVAIAASIATIVKSESLYTRVELSGAMSSNQIGMVCATGILCLSMAQSRLYNKYIKLGLNVLFLCAIVLTASRQSLIMAVIIYMYKWMLSVVNDKQKSCKSLVSNLCFISFVGITLIILISGGYLDVIYKTKLYARLTGSNRSTMVSDASRWNMYVDGFKVFWKKPFIGVGFDYVKYIFKYTHSTFMELLIGTGLFGFFIYFMPFLKCVKNFLRGFIREKGKLQKRYYGEKLLIGVVLIIMMATRSIVYYVFPMVVWALFICDYNYAKNEEVIDGQDEIQKNLY